MAEQQPFLDVGLATNPEPRCPCVLLLDVSGSMAEVVANAGQDTGQTVEQDGKTYRVLSGGTTRIDLLNEGVRAYQADVVSDSLAAQRVEVSMITFGASVETVVPFITAREFTAPTLTANGETPMGAAILQARRRALQHPAGGGSAVHPRLDGLEHLKELTSLERLFLKNTDVTDNGLVYLKGLTRVRPVSRQW